MAKRPTKRELWHPVDTYDEQDLRSIQLLARYAMGAERPWPPGEEPPVPTPMDVKRLFDFVINKSSQRYENPGMIALGTAHPDKVVWMMCGRMQVGKELSKLMVLKPDKVSGK